MSNQERNSPDRSTQVVGIDDGESPVSSVDSAELDRLLQGDDPNSPSSPDQPTLVGSAGQSLELNQSSGIDQSGFTTQLRQSSRIDQSASPAGAQSASQSDHDPVVQNNSGSTVPSTATSGQRQRKTRSQLNQSSGIDQPGSTIQRRQSSRIGQSGSPTGAQSASQSDHTPVAQNNSGFAVPSSASSGRRKRKARQEEIDVPCIPETPSKPSFMKLSLKQIDQLVEYYIPNPVIRGPEGGIHTYFNSPHMSNILALRPGLEDACISYRARYKDVWDSVAPVPVTESDLNRFKSSQEVAGILEEIRRPTFKWDDAAQEEVMQLSHLWYGDKTTPAGWYDLLNALRQWLNLQPGLAGIILSNSENPPPYSQYSVQLRSRMLFILKKIFTSGQANAILATQAIMGVDADPRDAMQQILTYYNVGEDTEAEQREQLLMSLRTPYCTGIDPVAWYNSINTKWIRIHKMAREATPRTWQNQIPHEKEIIQWMCYGKPAQPPPDKR